MRPFITFLLVLFNLPLVEAQINLVPNPSFEDTVFCPLGLDQMNAAIGWSAYRESPDYYNSCNQFSTSVPNANFGFQFANSGSAFMGVIAFHKNNSPVGNNYREFAGIELVTPLQVGTKYYFSFFTVLAERYTGFASNNLGLRFFNNQYSLSNPAPIDNFSHLKIDSILTDSINWHKISGSFIADSNYQYVSIGNFYDYLNCDTLIITTFATTAYYYVDDICVTTDSLYNITWTGLQNVIPNEVQIWPNPVQDYFQFKSIHKIDEINIFDSRGRLISNKKINSSEGRIDLGIISDGIYFATFGKEKTISVHKFHKF
jgi:hypothetical protein